MTVTTLDNFLFLAAYTSRSQAYAQSLLENDLDPGHVLLFGDGKKDISRPVAFDKSHTDEAGVFLPDLSVPLTESCERAGWEVDAIDEDDVNHPKIVGRVQVIRPDYVIYSGYGGQLVKEGLLGLGIQFLHMHSGWLPEYRGSTTLYYSWLTEWRCAVTAFFMDLEIDNGPIIQRHRYPTPPPGIDVDHLYDGAIRADMLVRVLSEFLTDGRFSPVSGDGETRTYYVIHPVLKHLAMLSRRTHG